LRHMGMQIKTNGDGGVFAGRLAQGGQQIALRIGKLRCAHGAVQFQCNGIGLETLYVGDESGLDLFEKVVIDKSAGGGDGGQARQDLHRVPLQRRNDPRQCG